jgi:hypothetical protein
VLDRGREAYADRLAAAADTLRWSRVAAPLRRLIDTSDPSRPLGARAGRPRPRSVGLRARDAGYVAARRVLNAAGREDWPRVR